MIIDKIKKMIKIKGVVTISYSVKFKNQPHVHETKAIREVESNLKDLESEVIKVCKGMIDNIKKCTNIEEVYVSKIKFRSDNGKETVYLYKSVPVYVYD